MRTRKRVEVVGILALVGPLGCAAPEVDFTKIQRPARSAELDAYNVFVGSWTWQAEMLNARAEDKSWTGTAEWRWMLDQNCLEGQLSAKSAKAEFEAVGLWSWHPKAKQYIWTMFNNWGYPQHGQAHYEAGPQTWTMDYQSVGLDGSASHGRYQIKVMDHDWLDWTLVEYADPLHMVKKMEMKGSYKRRK